jgi:uncharacterized phiE125 gp8 family phage protein
MGLELITAPASEPVSLAEAKAYLRVDAEDEDALIGSLVAAARAFAESHTGRAFVTQSWRLWCDAWPARVLVLPKAPLIAVTSIAVHDRSGAATTLSSDVYIVDSARQPGRIVLKDTAVLPAGLREANAIAVSFDAGYGVADDVPAALRNAVLSLVAHLYEARGDGLTAPPLECLAQLAPFRVLGL